jgi:G3E family GTPase
MISGSGLTHSTLLRAPYCRFLGSGKTTLLNYILTQNHGKRIAVIENEFGEESVDDALVKTKLNTEQQIIEMNNGCICCTVRGDLIRILTSLSKRVQSFDAILIETTGLADPAPVAQTFFMSQEISSFATLDAIVTVVDAKHISEHLLEKKPDGVENESVEQVAFADVLLLNKTDLVPASTLKTVTEQLRSINSVAKIIPSTHSVVDLSQILNIRAFDLARVTQMDPEFLAEDSTHVHDTSVTSVGITTDADLDQKKVQAWLSKLLREKGADIFRSKGVLAVKDSAEKIVFQGVHMLLTAEPLEAWAEGEKRQSKLVFIGRNLDREALTKGFLACVAATAKRT